MINKVFFYLLVIFCLGFSKLSFSGDPGGLFLFVMPMETGEEIKESIDNYFKQHYALSRDKTPSCEIQGATKMLVNQPQVDVYYLNSRVPGVDDDILENSISNNKSRGKLRRTLAKYRDTIIWNGFHAILFYKLTDNVVYFYGLSAIYKPAQLKKSSISVSELSDENKLGHALCLALAGLPTPAP